MHHLPQTSASIVASAVFKTGPVGLGYYLDKPWVNRKLGEVASLGLCAASLVCLLSQALWAAS